MSRETPAEVRKLILQRRARFVSVALASVGLAWGSKGCSPCLSVVPPPQRPEVTVDPPQDAAAAQGGSDPGPQVCLEAPPEPPPEPCLQPEPCLKLQPEPPRPCLSVVAPPPPPPGPCLSPPAPPPTVCLRSTVDPKGES